MMVGMISTELAVSLKAAGLVWHPHSGDRFQLDEPEFEADVFTVSEMTIEPREYPTGRILAFNGTTEWALDSVAQEDALWLPHEHQLRELLRGSFRSLRRLDDTHEVEVALPAAMARCCASSTRSRPTPTPSPCSSCCAASPERYTPIVSDAV